MKKKIILPILLLAIVIAITGTIAFTIKVDPSLLHMRTDNTKIIFAILGIAIVMEVILIATALGLALFKGFVTFCEALAWRSPNVHG